MLYKETHWWNFRCTSPPVWLYFSRAIGKKGHFTICGIKRGFYKNWSDKRQFSASRKKQPKWMNCWSNFQNQSKSGEPFCSLLLEGKFPRELTLPVICVVPLLWVRPLPITPPLPFLHTFLAF